MRETCARVLAAALMTGAIAVVVAVAALNRSPRIESHALTAPPSSLQRSVHVPALGGPAGAAPAERLATATLVRRPATTRPAVVRAEGGQGRVWTPRPEPPSTAATPPPTDNPP